ncbi:VOC family protein [Geodermatophilus maliterrae]|uniref:VOC family protein n=1 Tax=Geodermatophilus maliterrae TaxID=3162531 RepID=A0ABV3XI41_9ACTN
MTTLDTVTTLDRTAPTGRTTPDDRPKDVTGIVVVAVPVSDLARSAAWYRDLLGLAYVREFGDEQRVTGCALADWSAHYVIALRLRSTTAGRADLRGEHPVIVEAVDAAAAGRVRARADALGIAWTSGRHADGTWTEFLDPDGIALRVVHDAAGPQTFLGVRATAAGDPELYTEPRLALAAARP